MRKLFLLLLCFAAMTALFSAPASAQNLGGITTAPIERVSADAQTGYADAASVTSVTATVGVGFTGSTGQTVTYNSTAGPNSLPFFRALAVGAKLTTTGLSSSNLSHTFVLVERLPDAGQRWPFDSSAGRLILAHASVGVQYFDGGFETSHVAAPLNTWVVISWVLDNAAAAGHIFVNGTEAGTGATYAGKALGGTTAILNANDATSSSGSPAGDLAEIVVYDGVLSASDRSAVEQAEGAKYNITVAGGAGGGPTFTPTFAPNSAGFLYPVPGSAGSQGNWFVTPTAAKSINAGAYVRALIGGSATCRVGLNIGTATPYSEVEARLDGGPWQVYTPTVSGIQTWTLTMPPVTTSTTHLLEIVVKSTTETQDRWNTQSTAVQFLGVLLDAGATLVAPQRRKYLVYVFGDSITEGVRTNGFTGIANDTDRNDAAVDYSYRLGELLNAEVVVVGFGGSGVTRGGSGNVAALTSSYGLLWAGQARAFASVPDLVVYNEGANETTATLAVETTAFTTVIGGIGYGSATTYAGLSGTRHLILRPFNGAQAANLPSVAASFGSPNVVYGDTTGLWASTDASDNLHPYAYAHLGNLAPGVAALALPLLRPAAPSSAYRGQIRRGR